MWNSLKNDVTNQDQLILRELRMARRFGGAAVAGAAWFSLEAAWSKCWMGRAVWEREVKDIGKSKQGGR